MGKIIGLAGILAALSALCYVGLTAAFRLDLIGVTTVFSVLGILAWALLGLGILALFMGMVGLGTRKASIGGLALDGGIAALAAASGPVMMRVQAGEVPVIHDISTDTKYPPQFITARDILMADQHSNTTEYNAANAPKQVEAYPNLKTVEYDKSFEEVFQAALATVEGMGLEVIGTEENAGRIEATATTLWWGFKDDMVVRVNRFTSPVQVDVRSSSRIGRSDLGVNAKRIETFLSKLDQKLN